MSAIYIEAAV